MALSSANRLRLPWVYLTLSVLFIATVGYLLHTTDKAEFHLWLNSAHTPWLDTFMRYYTGLAEWGVYVVVAALLWYRAGWSVLLLTNLALSGIVAQRLKYVFDTLRPVSWFEYYYPDVQLPLVDGVNMSTMYSMPSGHTVTFFVFFFTLCLIWRNHHADRARSGILASTGIELAAMLLTIIGCYSRIYLSQHFTEDIFAGAIVALVVVLLLYIPLAFGYPKWQDSRFWNWNFRHFSLNRGHLLKK